MLHSVILCWICAISLFFFFFYNYLIGLNNTEIWVLSNYVCFYWAFIDILFYLFKLFQAVLILAVLPKDFRMFRIQNVHIVWSHLFNPRNKHCYLSKWVTEQIWNCILRRAICKTFKPETLKTVKNTSINNSTLYFLDAKWANFSYYDNVSY